MNEFDIIERYFVRPSNQPEIIHAIGDDAAVVRIDATQDYVFTLDNLVENIHFLPTMAPHALGYRLAAVNLSDLAAMGATPRYALLGLTLPHLSAPWLEQFSQGMFQLLDQFEVTLIGGNTTEGPLNVMMQLTGTAPHDAALTRSGAQAGDKIYVSGVLGAASFALQLMKAGADEMASYFNYPNPRIALGQALRGLATSAIDISDGLLADLNHLCQASQVGAKLHIENIPLFAGWEKMLSFSDMIAFALHGGDDYELCFTVPPSHAQKMDLSQALNLPCHCIGEIVEKPGLSLFYHGESFPLPTELGYVHFQKNR